jgi:hypothetical protein
MYGSMREDRRKPVLYRTYPRAAARDQIDST